MDWLKLTGEGKDNEEIVLAGCGWLGQIEVVSDESWLVRATG